jgi:hypothetical protein
VIVSRLPAERQKEILSRLAAAAAVGLVPPGSKDYDRECGLGGVRVADPFHVENGLHRHVLKTRRG